jgi:hypothetical protein
MISLAHKMKRGVSNGGVLGWWGDVGRIAGSSMSMAAALLALARFAPRADLLYSSAVLSAYEQELVRPCRPGGVWLCGELSRWRHLDPDNCLSCGNLEGHGDGWRACASAQQGVLVLPTHFVGCISYRWQLEREAVALTLLLHQGRKLLAPRAHGRLAYSEHRAVLFVER